jgi:hypothetical protein
LIATGISWKIGWGRVGGRGGDAATPLHPHILALLCRLVFVKNYIKTIFVSSMFLKVPSGQIGSA